MRNTVENVWPSSAGSLQRVRIRMDQSNEVHTACKVVVGQIVKFLHCGQLLAGWYRRGESEERKRGSGKVCVCVYVYGYSAVPAFIESATSV